MFDLAQLAIEDSAVHHLRHPVTQEELYADAAKTQPLEVVLRSQASKEYRAAQKALQNRTLMRQRKKETLKAEDVEEEGLRLLVAATASFNNLSYNGEKLDNEITIRALYADPKFGWLRAQVDEALGDISTFLEQ